MHQAESTHRYDYRAGGEGGTLQEGYLDEETLDCGEQAGGQIGVWRKKRG